MKDLNNEKKNAESRLAGHNPKIRPASMAPRWTAGTNQMRCSPRRLRHRPARSLRTPARINRQSGSHVARLCAGQPRQRLVENRPALSRENFLGLIYHKKVTAWGLGMGLGFTLGEMHKTNITNIIGRSTFTLPCTKIVQPVQLLYSSGITYTYASISNSNSMN